MGQIYQKAFTYFGRSLPFLLLMSALAEGMAALFPGRSVQGTHYVFLILMACYFHRHFLFGEEITFRKPANPGPRFRFGWFAVASVAMIGLSVLLGFLAARLLVGPMASAPRDQFIGAFILSVLPAYLIVLSLFGMGLPAIVARNGFYRLTQGFRASPRIALRLLMGPTVVGGAIFALAIPIEAFFAMFPVMNSAPGLWALGSLFTTLGFLPTILAVAVLCQAHQEAYPTQPPGEPNGP